MGHVSHEEESAHHVASGGQLSAAGRHVGRGLSRELGRASTALLTRGTDDGDV